MQNDNSSQILVFDKDLESYIFNSAKYYALKLIRNGFYSFYEVNDLEQEILALFYCHLKPPVRLGVQFSFSDETL